MAEFRDDGATTPEGCEQIADIRLDAAMRQHVTHHDDCGCLSARHAKEIADANAAIKRLQRKLDKATDALVDCEEYFDQRADADAVGDPPSFQGNTEMTLLGIVRRALGKE